MVMKSSRLRLVSEGKAIRTNREEITQQGSLDSILKGEETRGNEAGKKRGKETSGVEDPLMHHQAKAIAEAIGLQKAWSSSVRDNGNSLKVSYRRLTLLKHKILWIGPSCGLR